MLLFCSKVHIIFFLHTFIPTRFKSDIFKQKKHLTIFSSENEKDLKDQFQLFVCEPINCEQQEKEEEGEKKHTTLHHLSHLAEFSIERNP